MALLGLGVGMTMQNLVLAVQNQVGQSDLGAASSTVTFFRSLGGAIGVSALGAVLGHQVTDPGRRPAWPGWGSPPSADGATGGIPDLAGAAGARCARSSRTPTGWRPAHIFLVAAPFALLALGAIIAMTRGAAAAHT